jgi:hypothetical protein
VKPVPESLFAHREAFAPAQTGSDQNDWVTFGEYGWSVLESAEAEGVP